MTAIDRTLIDEFRYDKTLKKLKEVLSFYKIENYPVCDDCNEPILYSNTGFRISKDGKVYHSGSQKLIKTVNGVEYKIRICENCLRPQLSERTLRKVRRFNAFGEAVRIACRIPEELINSVNSTRAVTLEILQRKYGPEDGQRRYDIYRRKQADSNRFEYKQKRYGWTKEQFDEFNKSRASTLENFIKRHGDVEGREKWEEYRKMQSETSTNEYMIANQSAERMNYIVEARVRSYKWFLIKCNGDEEKAKSMFINCKRLNKNYSIESKLFFDRVIKAVKSSVMKLPNVLYADEELKLFDDAQKREYYYDFCIPDIGLIVEYHGDMWHANPEKYGPDDYTNTFYARSNRKAKDVWAHDDNKKLIAKMHGFEVIVVWSSSAKNQQSEVVNLIIEKLNNLHKNNKNNGI